MIKRKSILKIAIDSPAAAGAGTVAKAISKHYNLFYLDTGKIYRYIGLLRLRFKSKFSNKLVKKKIRNLNLNLLLNKNLLSDEVAISAAIIARDKNIRTIAELETIGIN